MRYRKSYRGMLDMGRPRVPPLPQYIVLTDRDDGTLWLLSHSATTDTDPDEFGHIRITDVLPNKDAYITYPSYGEPWFKTNPHMRLIVRGGRLGYEYLSLPTGITDRDQNRLLTRRGNESRVREIIVPSVWERESDVMGWQVIDI